MTNKSNTTDQTSAQASNSLIFKTEKIHNDTLICVSIRLNDECKNGHQDFSITGDIWEANKPKIDKYYLGGGCCHDDILELFPEFKIFVDLHLCDYTGAPMYAIENGLYHMKDKQTAMKYLRISEKQYNKLNITTDKLYFGYLLHDLGIVKQWNEEAKKAIKLLETLTNKTFVIDSKRTQINYTKEDNKIVLERIKAGYYNPETIQQRETEKQEQETAKLLEGFKQDRDKAISKAQNEYNVKMFVYTSGYKGDNFIYYTHSNSLVFNWLTYKDKIKGEQFHEIIENCESNKYFKLLPKDFKISIDKEGLIITLK